MALQTKSLTANGSKGHHKFTLKVDENTTSTPGNTSSVSFSFKISPIQNGWDWYYYNNTISYSVNINGQNFSGYIPNYDGSSTVTLASSTFNITHENNGKKTISISFSVSDASSASYTCGNASASSTMILTTIPRATSCPSLSGDIESTYNIALNPASSNFTHSLKVSFGSISQYINANGNLQASEYKFSNNNINFTIPSSFYQQFSGKSGTGTLTLTTYSGSTNIGTKTSTLTANCLESRCRPSISGTAVDINSTTIALTGSSSKIIKGFSNVKLTLTLKAATSTGDTKSTISSRNVDGTSFSGSEVTLNKVSKKDFNVTVTNSRGFSTTTTISAGSLVNYFTPNMNVDFYRVDQTSSNIKLTYSGTFFNQSFGSVSNAITLKWYWKKSTDSSWTTGGEITPTINGNNIASATIDCGSTYDYQTNYRFKLEAIDKLSNGNREMDVTAGIPNFSFGENWFQHHTKLYDSSANEILSAKKMFPVGSIFITVTNTNPQTFLGGTWTAFGQGRTLVGVDTSQSEFNTVLKTGGEKTHKLTVDEMPSHDHKRPNSILYNGNSSWWMGGTGGTTIEVNDTPTTSAGGNQGHNNLQPYITVYFWRRTA